MSNTSRAQDRAVAGEVKIDGKFVYSGLHPQLSDFGLRLWRLQLGDLTQISGDGPHLEFRVITPLLLMGMTRKQLCEGAKYFCTGPYLGSLEEFGGLGARDGSNLRWILELHFELLYREATLHVSISCTAGSIHPSSSAGWSRGGDRQTVDVRCAIPVSVIPLIVDGHHGFFLQKKLECETISDYLEAIKHGPPRLA